MGSVISDQHRSSLLNTIMHSVLVFLALVACAVASHGYHGGHHRSYGHHGGYTPGRRYGRSAEPEPEADADADPAYGYSVAVAHPTAYLGYSHYPRTAYSYGYPAYTRSYTYGHGLHKRSADAEAEPEAAPEAAPEATPEAEAEPAYGYSHLGRVYSHGYSRHYGYPYGYTRAYG